ncbi:MAG: ATPase, T2SS/T4P/T4SS family [Pseudomonadota bacterium]
MTAEAEQPPTASYLESYLGRFAAWLRDPGVVELAINPDGSIWSERAGDAWMRREAVTSAPVETLQLARAVVGGAGRKMSRRAPLGAGKVAFEGRPLRIQVVAAPAVEESAAIAIRLMPLGARTRHRPAFLHGAPVSLTEQRQTLLAEIVALAERDLEAALAHMVALRLNILISGGTSTGKTTVARGLLDHIGPDERLVTIEDALELFPTQPNTVAMIADRAPSSPHSTARLLEAALRLRPDRILVGELRGPEALTWLEAINTGHGGSMSTLHAETAPRAISRIAMMVLQAGTPLTFSEVAEYVAQSIDVIVQLGREDGRRGVTEVFLPGQSEKAPS